MTDNPLLSHTRLAEPLLSFDPTDASAVHQNPLAGLKQFGPHSSVLFGPDGTMLLIQDDPVRSGSGDGLDCDGRRNDAHVA